MAVIGFENKLCKFEFSESSRGERIINYIGTLEWNFFETTHRNFLKFCKTVSIVMMIHFQEKKWGVKFLPPIFIYLHKSL